MPNQLTVPEMLRLRDALEATLLEEVRRFEDRCAGCVVSSLDVQRASSMEKPGGYAVRVAARVLV